MSGRGNKGKGHAFPGDFIALGSKSGSSKASAPPPSTAHTAHAQPVKKMKGAEARAGIRTGERQGYTWENIAEEVDMVDLDTAIENCYRYIVMLFFSFTYIEQIYYDTSILS